MKNITFEQGIEISKQYQEEKKQFSKEKLQEFLESNCDMFSYADWLFYESETGKSIEWLFSNAKYSDPQGAHGTMLQNAIDFGDTELANLFI